MKRQPFYRRERKGCQSYKERIIWQLSKGVMTGRQLCHVLKLTRRELYGAMYDSMKGGKVVLVERFDRYVDDLGEDWHYRLVETPKFVAPKVSSARQNIIISSRRYGRNHEEDRRRNTEKAAIRARLIEAGLYIDELG